MAIYKVKYNMETKTFEEGEFNVDSQFLVISIGSIILSEGKQEERNISFFRDRKPMVKRCLGYEIKKISMPMKDFKNNLAYGEEIKISFVIDEELEEWEDENYEAKMSYKTGNGISSGRSYILGRD